MAHQRIPGFPAAQLRIWGLVLAHHPFMTCNAPVSRGVFRINSLLEFDPKLSRF
jgi:hypothetical protein